MKRQRHADPAQGAKDKKRKRKDDSDNNHTHKLPRNVSTPQNVASTVHAQPAEVLSGFERMDEETTTYLNEVKAHLDSLEDMEDISLLVYFAIRGLLQHLKNLVNLCSARLSATSPGTASLCLECVRCSTVKEACALHF